ncbi:MAG TPA: hypothetical protein VHV83_19780, partial [Armatimonadota bacterium]|nr:hypothetical protein [Armatimonadota bacterium]
MRTLLFLAIILCAGLSPVFAASWVEYHSPLAIVYVHPGEQQLATQIGAMAGEEYLRIAGTINLSTTPCVPIYAYTDPVEFLRDAGPRPLLLGVSYRPSGLIRIDATGQEGPVHEVLAHELTHSLLNAKLGPSIGNLPNWVDEGIAGYLADPLTAQQQSGASHQRHSDGVLTLDGMDQAFRTGIGDDAAYVQSRAMIAWLDTRYPG